jgi:hypothetical protein
MADLSYVLNSSPLSNNDLPPLKRRDFFTNACSTRGVDHVNASGKDDSSSCSLHTTSPTGSSNASLPLIRGVKGEPIAGTRNFEVKRHSGSSSGPGLPCCRIGKSRTRPHEARGMRSSHSSEVPSRVLKRLLFSCFMQVGRKAAISRSHDASVSDTFTQERGVPGAVVGGPVEDLVGDNAGPWVFAVC